jgi:hypothetical protein
MAVAKTSVKHTLPMPAFPSQEGLLMYVKGLSYAPVAGTLALEG